MQDGADLNIPPAPAPEDGAAPFFQPPSGKIIKAGGLGAVEAAQKDVRKAEALARDIVAKAEAEAAAIRAAAEEEGRRAIAELCAHCAARIDADLEQMRADMPDLVMRALRLTLSGVDAEKLAAAAALRAIEEYGGARKMTLHIAPGLAQKVSDLLGEMGAAERVRVAPDPSRPANSTLLETPYGDIELGIEAQLSAIARAMRA